MTATITVSDLQDAKTYVTTVDEYVLSRVRTRNPELPETWLRMQRQGFIELAAYLSNDAAQLRDLN